jgi:hypothetical protein
MSIKDITDYVRLTPGNTNPSVIGSMVQSEVNGTLKESKAYTDEQIRMLSESGRVGRVENPAEVLTFDGNTEGKFTLTLEGITFVRVSEKVYDLTKATSMTIDGETVPLPISEFPMSTNEFKIDGILFIRVISKEEVENLGGLEGVKAGTYFCVAHDLEEGYPDVFVERLEFPETVHTIDPKFIPGVCLPVVELDYEGTLPIQLTLTEEQIAIVNAAAKAGTPIVVRLTQTDGGISAVYNLCMSMQYLPAEQQGAAMVNAYGCEAYIEFTAEAGAFVMEPIES